jgi:hypothetical protein
MIRADRCAKIQRLEPGPTGRTRLRDIQDSAASQVGDEFKRCATWSLMR